MRQFAIAACLVLPIGIAVACREPTQLLVRFRSNACGDRPSLGVVTGPSLELVRQRVEAKTIVASQALCVSQNLLGTLVLTPGDGDTGALVAVIALRGSRTPEECLANEASPGCITARRQFSFLRGIPLELTIDLDLDCEGKACGAFATCRNNACVDPNVTCEESGRCPDPRPNDAGGIPDAPQVRDVSAPDTNTLDLCPTQRTCKDGAGCADDTYCCLFAPSTPPGLNFGRTCITRAQVTSQQSCVYAGCCAHDVPCPQGYECCASPPVGYLAECRPKGMCDAAATRYCTTTADCRAGEACTESGLGPARSGRGADTPPPVLTCAKM